MGTPLLRGRAFSERDRPDSPLVTVVTQSFARKYFGDADPIGRRIGQTIPEIEIVGVVGDAKYQDGRDRPREMFFLPYLQDTAESRARAATMKVRIDRSHYPQAIVLQYVNLSNYPEQEYFGDWLTDDLTTDLSKLSGLFVIARNSA